MSRVEGMAAIASKRLAAQAELQQLIAGTGSLLAAGTSLGEQAIAVCYTRSGDRTTHTQEFYPEGFYTLEQVAKMLQIHQTFGGKCMYEMFCDAAGGIVDVIAPGEIVEGLDHIGPTYAVSGDDTYLYLGGNGFLTVIRKSDWSIVPGTPILNVTAVSVVNDDNYVYLAYQGGNGYSIVRKSDWSLVSDTTPLPGYSPYGLDIHVDADYVYIAHYDGLGYTILRKSDWSLVTDLPNIPSYGPSSGSGIHADADYVYITHPYGNGYSILRKSDWSLVPDTTPLIKGWHGDAHGRDIHADADYVYIAHYGGLGYTILRKSDWSLVETTVKMPGSSAISITADSNYVYITSGAVGSPDDLVVLRKSDWSQVEGIPPAPSMPQDVGGEIHLDANYLYIPQVDRPGLIITPRPTN